MIAVNDQRVQQLLVDVRNRFYDQPEVVRAFEKEIRNARRTPDKTINLDVAMEMAMKKLQSSPCAVAFAR